MPSGALITTAQYPYLISGVSPDAMTASKLNVEQAGVSKWSITSVDGDDRLCESRWLGCGQRRQRCMAKSETFFHPRGLARAVFSRAFRHAIFCLGWAADSVWR